MKNNLFVILVILIIGIGCDRLANNIGKQEAAIYSILIDKMATPFPPPPPPPKDGSESKSINFDSISKVQVEVVVDTMMFHILRASTLNEEFSEYQNLVNSISSLAAKPVKTEYIKSEERHTLIFGDSLEDSDSQYSQMVGISRIAFNEKKNMAALYAGHSTHPLASYLDLFLLEKRNGRWEIVFRRNVEIS